MVLIGFLIFIICLINYYLKRDIFLTTIIGLILITFYIIIESNFSLNVLTYQKNTNIYLDFLLVGGLIITFRAMNDKLIHSYIKQEIQIIFDKLLKEKKIKILVIVLMSFLMYKTPILSIIYLTFLASFFRLSKNTMFFLPIISVTISYSFNYLANNIKGLDVFLNFRVFILILVIYILVILVYLIEKTKKKLSENKVLLKDLLFYLIIFLVTTFLIFETKNIIDIKMSFLFSYISSIMIGIYLVNNINMFKNPEVHDQKDLVEKKLKALQRLKLPYLMIGLFLLFYILGYIFYYYNHTLGEVFLITINIGFVNMAKSSKTKINVDYLKVLIILLLISINYILIKEIYLFNLENINSIIDMYILEKRNILTILITSTAFLFYPPFEISFGALSVINLNLIKVIMSINIQMIASFFTLYILSFIFNIKKRDMLLLVSLTLISSFVIQFIIYII